MIDKIRLLKLLVVFLMLVAASIAANKSIFGKDFASNLRQPETETIEETGAVVTINTGGLDGTIDGYAGPVPLEVTFENGRISAIEAPPNSETPSFFKRAAVLFEQWIGKTPAEAAAMKVDAISGATYSSNAIISNVNAAVGSYSGLQAEKAPGVPLKVWIALAVTLAACIVPLFVKSKVYYNVQLIANVIVLGFWAGQFLDYHVIMEFMGRGVALPLGLVTIVMLIAAFIYPVFGKPQYYCTHVCPLGSAQILVGQLCKYKLKISPSVFRSLDWFRRILWSLLMLSLWANTFTGWMDWELFQAFQFESASTWIIAVAIVFILLSSVVSRPYCRFVCPTGSLFKCIDNN